MKFLANAAPAMRRGSRGGVRARDAVCWTRTRRRSLSLRLLKEGAVSAERASAATGRRARSASLIRGIFTKLRTGGPDVALALDEAERVLDLDVRHIGSWRTACRRVGVVGHDRAIQATAAACAARVAIVRGPTAPGSVAGHAGLQRAPGAVGGRLRASPAKRPQQAPARERCRQRRSHGLTGRTAPRPSRVSGEPPREHRNGVRFPEHC